MSTFTIVFQDGTELNGLTYAESEKAMAESEETDNPWARVFVDSPTDYTPC